MIDNAGKRETFIGMFDRTPEEYLAEHSDKEPPNGKRETEEGHNIWLYILSDLNII